MSRKKKLPDMRPVDGEYVHSAAVRRKACKKLDHPMIYINLSKSLKSTGEVRQCHCGEREETFPKQDSTPLEEQ